jgi:hypothetical protein
MRALLPVAHWYVLAALLAPAGYMVQDAVADAMTVEAVPRVDPQGRPYDAGTRKLMHTTMQTLGRVAIIGGGILVALANVILFQGADSLPQAQKAVLYAEIYKLALIIPVVSLTGIALAALLQRRQRARLARHGYGPDEIERMLSAQGEEKTRPNWSVLGGSLVFVVVTLSVGLSRLPFAKEIIFLGSLGIVLFLLWRLARELEPAAREVLVATALVLFVFRAMPGPGAGSTWWMIDKLGFSGAFLSELSLIASVLTLAGMFIFRRYMAEKSISQIIVMLTFVGTALGLPILGMFYGLHQWTAAHTGGVVNAHFIALVDTALESPLGQIAMIPMLAWIANSAPPQLKATYFAVMASFANLALSAAQLGTEYLNRIFVVTREVKNHATGAVLVPEDYHALGALLISASLVGLLLPLIAVGIVRIAGLRTA